MIHQRRLSPPIILLLPSSPPALLLSHSLHRNYSQFSPGVWCLGRLTAVLADAASASSFFFLFFLNSFFFPSSVIKTSGVGTHHIQRGEINLPLVRLPLPELISDNVPDNTRLSEWRPLVFHSFPWQLSHKKKRKSSAFFFFFSSSTKQQNGSKKGKKEVMAKRQHQSSQPAGQTWLTLTQWKSGSGPAAADRRPLLFPESMESFSGVWKKVSGRGKSLQCPIRKHFAAAVKLILAVAPPSLPLQRKLIGPVVFRLAEKNWFCVEAS